MKALRNVGTAMIVAVSFLFYAPQAFAENIDLRNLLQQGLLGAGVGAISAEVSGGKAGTGALVGAGTNVIGGALLGFLTGSPNETRQSTYYAQPYDEPYYNYTPAPSVAQQVVYQREPVYVQPAPAYTYAQPRNDYNKTIIKQGLLGAGVGAISAGASGGKTGTGALIGAGTNVIGGALLDFLMAPATSGSSYSTPVPAGQTPSRRHILRKFDAAGHVISEEEFWD